MTMLFALLLACKPEVEKPTVVTKSVGEVTETSAKVVGQVAADGGAEVTERGVCWSSDGTPTILDYRVKDVEGGLGSYDVIITDLVPNTQYYVRAYATNKAGTSYGDEKTITTLEDTPEEPGDEPEEPGDEPEEPETPMHNGHEYVDLGLPSGKKWATCNVGASSPEGYGNYYAWGETSPKAEYTLENYQHWVDADGDGDWDYGESTINSDISGSAQYDAATANWGGGWRMPTIDEMWELENNCEWEWTQINGVNGARVVGPNGHCIFLPSAGYRNWSSLSNEGNFGYYWSSTPDGYYDGDAYGLGFYDGSEFVGWGNGRYYGLTVRPITE